MTDTRIGIIYPGDGALDREYWDFTPEGVSLHFTRQPLLHDGPVGLPVMSALVDDESIESCSESLRVIHPAAVAFACTSASFIRGIAGEQSICAVRVSRAAPRG